MKLAIYGYGGFGRELVAPIRATTSDPLIFVDDCPATSRFEDIEVHKPDVLEAGDRFVIAVADARIRRMLEQRCLDAGLIPYTFKAPTSLIGPDVQIGEGAVLCDFTVITASARIGRQFHANVYSYVAHDCVIGDYVTFAPKVCCNGNVHVGDGAYIGTGAVLKQGTAESPLVIGENAVLGMGAVVTKNVPAGATVVGNPAREMPRRTAASPQPVPDLPLHPR